MKESGSDKLSVCPIDLSKLKSKVAEAIELCGGDIDCLVKLDQVLSEATELCTGAISLVVQKSHEKLMAWGIGKR